MEKKNTKRGMFNGTYGRYDENTKRGRSLIVNPNIVILVCVLVADARNLDGVIDFKKRGSLGIFSYALPIKHEADLIAEDDFPLAEVDVCLAIEEAKRCRFEEEVTLIMKKASWTTPRVMR